MFTDSDAGRYVCHYTTSETFLTHILPTMRLRMSSFARVNDPRESRGWWCSLTVPPEVEVDASKWDLVALSARFTDYMKKTAKLLCVTRDGDQAFDPNRSAQLYGRGYAHPSMWDRYADRHSGVCLMLDVDQLAGAIGRASEGRGNVYYGGVSYEDMPAPENPAFHLNALEIVLHGEEEVFRNHQAKHYGALYFWKSLDWAAEFEYRWVVLDHEEADIFVDINNCLSGVIFGDAFPEHAIPMIADVVARKDIHLARMIYRNGHPIVLPALGRPVHQRGGI